MMDRRDAPTQDEAIHPLKLLTRDQFAALGGDAVAYIRPLSGAALATLIGTGEFEALSLYQLVMSADGTPLMVGDSPEAVVDWLGEQSLGVATLH